MKFIYYLILLSQTFFSCKRKFDTDAIIIKARIKNIPANKVYIARANQWNEFLDSADYIKDSFTFQIEIKNNFSPLMVSIAIIDTIDGKTKTLYFRNSILSPPPDSTKYLTNFFILEKGVTDIKGVYNSYNQLEISAGAETLAMFKTQMISFGYIDGESKERKKTAIELYKRIIKDYPSSYYLFEKLLENKELYGSDELIEYLGLFTPELQKSKLAEILNEYISNRPNPTDIVPELILTNVKGNKTMVIDQNAKISILVFWASWCAPCRAEIPELKKLFTDFKSKGLSIASISIDEDRNKWANAMQQEKMPWPQFIVDSAAINTIKRRYDFSAIPFTMIVDQKGKPLLRSLGFDASKKYEEKKIFIDSLLQQIR